MTRDGKGEGLEDFGLDDGDVELQDDIDFGDLDPDDFIPDDEDFSLKEEFELPEPAAATAPAH